MRTGRPRRPLILPADEQERLQSLARRARSQPLLARTGDFGLRQSLLNQVVTRGLRCLPGHGEQVALAVPEGAPRRTP